MPTSVVTTQEIYRILRAHLKDEQITNILCDLLHVSGNRSFKITVGALCNLHNIRAGRRRALENVQE
jgi:hypothetical protein